MDPLSIIAGVTGIVGFAVASTKNLIAVVEKSRGAPAAIRRTSRDAFEFLLVLRNFESLLTDEDLRSDETIQNVFRSVEGPIRASQEALDELMVVVEGYVEREGGKWNSLKWTFKDEERVKVLNERLGMSKTTLAFALTTINTYVDFLPGNPLFTLY